MLLIGEQTMTDKKLTNVTDNNVGKMTDSEIVKALECCIDSNCCKENCPIFDERDSLSLCTSKLSRYALGLINHIQAENEELKTENLILSQKRFNIFERIEFTDKFKKQAKAEAYTEYGELYKSKLDHPFIQRAGKEYVNFLKAMVDDTKKELGEKS